MTATAFYAEAETANRAGNTATVPADITGARSRESTAIRRAGVLYGTAAVLVTAAVAMYVIDRSGAKRKEIAVTPVITTDKVGVCVLFNF